MNRPVLQIRLFATDGVPELCTIEIPRSMSEVKPAGTECLHRSVEDSYEPSESEPALKSLDYPEH